MPFSKHFNAELYNKFSGDLQLAGFAKRTFDGYLREIRKLADHCQCSPEHISGGQGNASRGSATVLTSVNS